MTDAQVKTDIPDVEAELEKLPACDYCGNEFASPIAHQADCVERARKLVEEHRSHQERDCLEEIQTVLDRYGMQLTATPAQIVLGPRSS